MYWKKILLWLDIQIKDKVINIDKDKSDVRSCALPIKGARPVSKNADLINADQLALTRRRLVLAHRGGQPADNSK